MAVSHELGGTKFVLLGGRDVKDLEGLGTGFSVQAFCEKFETYVHVPEAKQQAVTILEEVRIPGEDKALRVPTLADEFGGKLG